MRDDFSCQRDKKIILKEKGITRIIDMKDVIALVCEGYVTTVLLVDNQDITISKLLKEFELELKEYGFLRINHNTVINSRHISSIEGGKRRVITLLDDFQFKISRRKLFQFK